MVLGPGNFTSPSLVSLRFQNIFPSLPFSSDRHKLKQFKFFLHLSLLFDNKMNYSKYVSGTLYHEKYFIVLKLSRVFYFDKLACNISKLESILFELFRNLKIEHE